MATPDSTEIKKKGKIKAEFKPLATNTGLPIEQATPPTGDGGSGGGNGSGGGPIEPTGDGGEIILGLADMLTGMVQATIAADQKASDDYIELLEKYAFETDPVTGHQRLKMVDIEMTDADGNEQIMSVPKLSLLAPTCLRISEAVFDLDAHVSFDKSKLAEIEAEEKAAAASGTASITKLQIAKALKLTIKKQPEERIVRADRAQVLAAAAAKAEGDPKKAIKKETESLQSENNLKVTIKLAPSILPNGMRSLIQESQSMITVKNVTKNHNE